ncbi:MAG TPA: hypothetical protein PK264_20655, partial [Hyphomicrobiaceae bacterium]|nr:hypothetical protein [Hyphomicrobiaceae bacterium]
RLRAVGKRYAAAARRARIGEGGKCFSEEGLSIIGIGGKASVCHPECGTTADKPFTGPVEMEQPTARLDDEDRNRKLVQHRREQHLESRARTDRALAEHHALREFRKAAETCRCACLILGHSTLLSCRSICGTSTTNIAAEAALARGSQNERERTVSGAAPRWRCRFTLD